MNNPHSQDYTGECHERGMSAEKLFAVIARRRGNKIKPATKKEQFKHFDYHMKDANGHVWKIEVKAAKKKSRSDSEVDSSIQYVEFKNVNGFNGWLIGQSDFIAFEREDDFVIVRRNHLLNLSNKLVDKSKFTQRPTLYKSYRRKSRPLEHTSMIKMDDILTLNHSLWSKD